MMDEVTVRHIALFVPDLPAAEEFYRGIFDSQLLMRESEMDDGLWYSLPLDKGWLDAEEAGIQIDMIALKRGEFVLALFRGQPDPKATVLEIGVSMPPADITALRDRLPESVELLPHEHGDLMVRDPFGYVWHFWPAGTPFTSNGESSGRWLEL
jgi:catechol 2,3-dioxygenase-like lactoylglutathione lyase family enzyme